MKTMQGVITSLKTSNTAQVLVTRKWQHPLYGKFVKRSKQFACHIEDPKKMKLEEGQTVTIQETKPVSKTKRFKVMGVVKE